LLFHGSFLLQLDLELVEKVLPLPSKQPEYRHGRKHAEFLMNLKIGPAILKEALMKAWKAEEPHVEIPFDEIGLLAREKYSRDDWNLRFAKTIEGGRCGEGGVENHDAGGN
jgi:lipoate-protein ligase A